MQIKTIAADTNLSSAGWTYTNASNLLEAVAAADTKRANASGTAYCTLQATRPSTPIGLVFRRVGVTAKWSAGSGGLSKALLSDSGALSYDFRAAWNAVFASANEAQFWAPAGMDAAGTVNLELQVTTFGYLDQLATVWDYRHLPVFTIADLDGSTRTPVVQITAVDLDGLDATSWEVAVTGPMEWAASGAGNWPTYGVTVENELVDGTYDVQVTIRTDVGSTSHTASLTVASAVPPPYLASTVFEGTLAAHFSMACASVAGSWWAAADGTLKFARFRDTDYAVLLSDVDEPGAVLYTALGISNDSRQLINTLNVNNHSAEYDVPSGEWVATDTTETYVKASSVAVWGARSETVDLCIYDVGGGSVDSRAAALLQRHAAPVRTVDFVTFNAQAYPAAAKTDLNRKILIRRAGTTYGCAVVGIEHTQGPDRWFTTFRLVKE